MLFLLFPTFLAHPLLFILSYQHLIMLSSPKLFFGLSRCYPSLTTKLLIRVFIWGPPWSNSPLLAQSSPDAHHIGKKFLLFLWKKTKKNQKQIIPRFAAPFSGGKFLMLPQIECITLLQNFGKTFLPKSCQLVLLC